MIDNTTSSTHSSSHAYDRRICLSKSIDKKKYSFDVNTIFNCLFSYTKFYTSSSIIMLVINNITLFFRFNFSKFFTWSMSNKRFCSSSTSIISYYLLVFCILFTIRYNYSFNTIYTDSSCYWYW
jgi:hypothetical protein